MKVPLIWLQDYLQTTKSAKQLANSFTLLGLMLDKPLGTDNVLDLEQRMDRSDWLGILGCARDLAAFENIKITLPALYEEALQIPKNSELIKVNVECPGLINRFKTVVVKNIKVEPSPEWLQQRLTQYGMPCINNIVDITNFVMVELGQPMHAHDLNKMPTPELTLRYAQPTEQITTLLGETVKLDEETFVISNNNVATVIGGIVGGKTTGVDTTTTQILLDSGSYDQVYIRKASRKFKIQNETVLRYDKYLHPYANELAIKRALYLIKQICPQAEFYDNDDYYPKVWQPITKTLRVERLNLISGMQFTSQQASEILQRLQYKILKQDNEKLEVEVPYFRTDIDVEDDLASDVLRIYGYQNIDSQPIVSTVPNNISSKMYLFEEQLKQLMLNLGANEYITDSLVQSNKFETEKNEMIVLQNALTSEKNALRTDIKQTLMPVVEIYKKHKIDKISLFEVGKVFKKAKNQPSSNLQYTDLTEERHLTYIYSSAQTVQEINTHVKQILATLLKQLNLSNYQLVNHTKNSVDIIINKNKIGELTLNSFTLNTQELFKLVEYPVKREILDAIPNLSTQSLTINCNIDKYLGGIYQTIKNNQNVYTVKVTDEFLQTEKNIKAITFEITYKQDCNVKQTREEIINNIKQLDSSLHIIS